GSEAGSRQGAGGDGRPQGRSTEPEGPPHHGAASGRAATPSARVRRRDQETKTILASHQSTAQVSPRPPKSETPMLELAGWDSFYVIIGSSAAALTGLMFVVIALTGEVLATPAAIGTIRAFSTPTVVHFGAVLLLAALLTTPGHTVLTLSGSVGACGFAGLCFIRWVMVQMRRQTAYAPIAADWEWHVRWPALAYTCLL